MNLLSGRKTWFFIDGLLRMKMLGMVLFRFIKHVRNMVTACIGI